MARVLVVDDEAQILTALARGLRRAGHDVVVARTAADGLAAAAAGQPEVILLDLRLPDGDGIEVVRQIRAFSQVPIVLLSGAATERTRVEALDAGADDFVDKPFSMEELRARVGAALRRSAAASDGNGGAHVSGAGQAASATASTNGGAGLVRFGELCIDHGARTVHRGTELVRLTPTEWRLLVTLAAHPGR
ncbi:MAG: response regulator transcription factor, partial [Nitriliruptoraceae bacterium]